MASSTMAYSADVYYGPSSATNPTMGSVTKGEAVTVQWKEGSWYYIQYTVSSTGQYKCGYVNEYAVNTNGNLFPDHTSTIASNLSLGPSTLKCGGKVFLGSNFSYPQGGAVDTGERVYIAYGISNDGWKFIQYNTSSGKKRGWVPNYYFTG